MYDLSGEAIRLGRLLVELLPQPEAIGLLALMLLHESRRAARSSATGELVLLGEQDRSLWNREQIAEGSALVQSARLRHGASVRTRCRRRSPRCTHRRRPQMRPTGARSWGCTTLLLRAEPSPVVELNRAVAVAMSDGPAAGLALIDAILARGDLRDYHLAHAARADLCRRLNDTAQARASYERALALARQAPERRFLERRLAELQAPDATG